MELWSKRPGVEPDKRDEEILARSIREFDAIAGPRVGDFIDFGDGIERRFSHDWGTEIQTTDGRYGSSFYFHDGSISFSGGLDPGIPIEQIEPTAETRLGPVWFFHHHEVKAHNAVGASVPFRVFRLKQISNCAAQDSKDRNTEVSNA